MKSQFPGLALISGMIFLISCQINNVRSIADMKTELPLIKNSIQGCIGWAKDKDFKLLYSIIANDSDYLEVGPGPRVTKGFDEFKKNEAIWGDPGFKAIGYEIRDMEISLSQSGTVAWFYCILDDINEWKGEPASWLNTRWTGVLEKRNDHWVMVQMHFSFPKE